MKKTRMTICLAAVCMMAAGNVASADTIQGIINMEFVTIGNAGNAGDTRTELGPWGYPMARPYGCGAVDYNYRIGKYEVTNAQWNAFTAAAGAPTGSDGGYRYSAYWTGAQQPTNNVSWYEAVQFCNYLTTGDKSKGAYQFSGNNANPGSFMGVNRDAAKTAYSTVYVIPTEDEWYKAAYFKPNASGYSLYANGLNTIPAADNGWNYYGGAYSSPWAVGTGNQEQNGTKDMMGNVMEWNETLLYRVYRGLRGGSYSSVGSVNDADCLVSSYWVNCDPYGEDTSFGFRVASIVPEPASLTLLFLGGLLIRRK